MFEAEGVDPKRHRALISDRINKIGWGLFLVILGIIWLLPDSMIPDGALLIGIGIILLGLSFVRHQYGIKRSDTNIVLGIIALAFGLGDFLGTGLPLIPILLIFWGLSIFYRIIFSRKK